MDSSDNSNSLQHIVSNFSMYGMNAEWGLLQSIKELVENSLDAGRALARPGGTEINIHIKGHPLPHTCTLEVLDNGSGIPDIARALGCFSTTKTVSSETTAGKFGVGLSSIILYSQVSTNSSVRIITKPSSEERSSLCNINDCAFSPLTGAVSILFQEDVTLPNFPCGTLIRVALPQPPDLTATIAQAEIYFKKLKSVPRNSFHASIDVALPELRTTLEYHSFASTAPLVNSHQNFSDIMGSPYANVHVASESYQDNDNCIESILWISQCGGIVCLADKYINVPFANNVPLLDYDDAALSCCIYAVVKRFPWHQYGLKLKVECTGDGRDAMRLHWVNYDAILVKENAPHDLLMHVNVLSPNVPYSSMKKCSVSHDAAIMRNMKIAIDGVLLKHQKERPDVFMSVRQYKEAAVLKSTVPSVCRSISTIIHLSKSSEFQVDCLRLLGVSTLDRRRTQDRLEELVRSIIIDKQTELDSHG